MTALAARAESGLTSSAVLAQSVGTHPAFLRGLLGLLKAAGLIEVKQGKTGGACLARPAQTITLAEVYVAVEEDPTVPTHACEPSATCFVGQGILEALEPALKDVEAAIVAKLGETTIADLLCACSNKSSSAPV